MAKDNRFINLPQDERSRLEQATSLLATTLVNGTVWLVTALGIATTLVVIYYLSHPYPAYGAGLYLSIAEEIVAHGYRLSPTVPGYTVNGVSFVYPPLGLYGVAILLDLGIDPIITTRLLPGIISVLTVIPFYYLTREIVDSPFRAGVAAVLFAVTPVVLQWHISAGGIVRAPAFLFTLTGLYYGVKLFQSGNRRKFAPAMILFGLTLLTHPTYSVFFGASYVLMYVFYDRSLTGLSTGIAVAVGGLVIALPWLTHIFSIHGIEPFVAAAGTHGGLVRLRSPFRLLSEVGRPIAAGRTTSIWYLLVLLGGGYLIARRRLFLPLWFVLSVVLLQDSRFWFVPGTIMIGTWMTAPHLVGSNEALKWATRWSLRGVTAGLLLLLITMSGFYVASVPLSGGTSLSPFIDNEDRAATAWVDGEVPADAEFVVVGDAAEWFPYLSDRTILVGPWGVEWNSPAKYHHHLKTYRRLSHCHSETCLSKQLLKNDITPDYVYVPKGSYTVRGIETKQRPRMRRSLIRSENYRLVYENQEVMVFQVEDIASDTVRSQAVSQWGVSYKTPETPSIFRDQTQTSAANIVTERFSQLPYQSNVGLTTNGWGHFSTAVSHSLIHASTTSLVTEILGRRLTA